MKVSKLKKSKSAKKCPSITTKRNKMGKKLAGRISKGHLSAQT